MNRASQADDLARLLADAIPHIVWTHDSDGVARYFNKRWVEYTGLDLEETLRCGAETLIHADDRENVVKMFADSRARGARAEAWYRLRRHDGAYRWHRGAVVPLDAVDGRISTWVGTATDADTERTLWNEQKFLVEASRVLGTSLDVAQTLNDVAKLVVPHLADWCAIDLVGPDGRIQRQAVAHVDPSKVALAWELWNKTPLHPDDPQGLYAVVRSRKPEHVEEITDEMLAAGLPDPELLAVYRRLELRSSMCVPLIARDHALGALTLVGAESGRRFRERDLEFAQEFARRIAIAVDNARLYTAATEARFAAEAMAQEVIEQSRAAETAVLEMRRERDDALARFTAQK